jgi:AcrR family transcriptional regulator
VQTVPTALGVPLPPALALTASDLLGSAGARDRILATASVLFYGVGIRATGIDRIIAAAGVAKATFYHHFATKDALVCAYLTDQHERQKAAIAPVLRAGGDPEELILRVFDALGDISCGEGFRGCVFVNAAVEYPDPDSSVRQVIAEHRTWFHGTLRELLAAAGHPDPGGAARLLVTLRDGVVVAGQLDQPEAVRATLRSAVGALVAIR